MNKYTDIVVIRGNWQGGHHGTHPKVLSVSPESDEPFGVSEGWGHGLGGNNFSLKELVEKEFIEIFNTKESEVVCLKIKDAYKKGVNQNILAKQLLGELGKNA
ncbi:hypothetical protein ACJJIK_11015 [Microbulbifer sp. ZKSA006]|uniref:hypothetical protein n=1 Tax=Microbulbifer sp. ZKSA006 TaxID=3243390 RepID=UPI00403A0986